MSYQSVIERVGVLNTLLWIELQEQTFEQRVETLRKITMSRESFVRAMEHKAYDELLKHHIELLFHVVRDMYTLPHMCMLNKNEWDWNDGVLEETKVTIHHDTVRHGAVLAREIFISLRVESDNNSKGRGSLDRPSPIPSLYVLTRDFLIETITQRWCMTRHEDEADQLITFIGDEWTRCSSEVGAIILKALRKGSTDCSAERRQRALVVLDKVRVNWSFSSSMDSPFSDIATGWMKTLVKRWPVRASRMAEIDTLMGDEPSDAAHAVLVERATHIGNINSAARSLIAHLRHAAGDNQWYVAEINDKPNFNFATIAGPRAADEDQASNILDVAFENARTWLNDRGVRILLKVAIAAETDDYMDRFLEQS